MARMVKKPEPIRKIKTKKYRNNIMLLCDNVFSVKAPNENNSKKI